jgi:type VI secretion system secreted protein VgrG
MSPTGPITVETPLGDTLVFRAMKCTEKLSSLFEYTLDLLNDDDELKLADLLGQPVTVHLELGHGKERTFNGFVTDLALAGTVGSRVLYRATVRPWLWFLTRTANCRIFQRMTAPDIVKQVFRDAGFSDFEDQIGATYPTWDFVVQYRETDFNFVSRLLERVGIYYYFKHDGQKHMLVLTDSYSGHAATPGCETLPYHQPDKNMDQLSEHVDRWELVHAVKPGAYALADFDFESPKHAVSASTSAPFDHDHADCEVFDYPGGYTKTDEGETCARVRLEELHATYERFFGHTNARGLSVGALFSLTDFPRDDQNREYLVTSASYTLKTHEYESTGAADYEPVSSCEFSAMDSSRQFRPPRTAAKPFVRGPQTATVVTSDDQEVWTDKYGRIKVRFHWDRYPPDKEEESSCWVRVAQIWAGEQWGAMHIPRKGQEVIVDFLEGDPDRPIVTGRVYNADNMPPYDLPANHTQSGIKSRSMPKGTPNNFNEIRFEDKKGHEELFVQAEKNQTTKVKKNQSISVGASRSVSVGGTESKSVGGNRSVHVKGNQTVTIDGGGKDTPHSSVSVTGKHKLHASDTIEVDAPTHIKLECGGSSIMIEPGKITITAGDGSTIVLDAKTLITAKDSGNIKIDADVLAKSKNGGSVKIDSDIKAASKGKSELTIDADVTGKSSTGKVALQAPQIAITADMKVAVSAGTGSVELDPAGAKVSGTKVSVAGSAMTEIQGALVKIN